MEKPPNSLYKYRSVNKFTLANLINQTIWFSGPMHLNDPFDCQLRISNTTLTKKSFDQSISREKKHLEKETGKRLVSIAPDGLFSGGDITNNFKAELNRFKKHLENNLSDTGVFSLSETYESTTMWGHYADSHKGICIGYDPLRLIPKVSMVGHLGKVEYEPYDKISFHAQDLFARYAIRGSHESVDQSITDITHRIVSTKIDDWSYEKEWRFIQRGTGNIQHPPKFVTSIHFGLKCNPEDKATIRNILADHPMRFYQMVRMNNAEGVQEVYMDKDSIYWAKAP